MKRAWGAALGWISVSLFAALASCREPTQVTLSLTTNARCQAEAGSADVLNDVAIYAAKSVDEKSLVATTVTNRCAPSGTGSRDIGTLVLVPGGANDTVEVLVIAGVNRLGEGKLTLSAEECTEYLDSGAVTAFAEETHGQSPPCIVARRRLAFVRGERLTLPVNLDTKCVGVICEKGSTCASGSCVSSDVTCSEGQCADPGGTTTSTTTSATVTATTGGVGGASATLGVTAATSTGSVGGMLATSSASIGASSSTTSTTSTTAASSGAGSGSVTSVTSTVGASTGTGPDGGCNTVIMMDPCDAATCAQACKQMNPSCLGGVCKSTSCICS